MEWGCHLSPQGASNVKLLLGVAESRAARRWWVRGSGSGHRTAVGVQGKEQCWQLA